MSRTKKISDEHILEIILGVIIEKGATQFSLMDLSEKTGLSPATLMQRFGTKTEILHKALTLSNQQLKHTLDIQTQSNTSAIQQIIDIYLSQASGFNKPETVAQGLDILKLDIVDPKLNQLTREYFQIRHKKITSLIQHAQKQGEIRNDLNAAEIAMTLEALWQGAIMQWALIGEGELAVWLKSRLFVVLQLKKGS